MPTGNQCVTRHVHESSDIKALLQQQQALLHKIASKQNQMEAKQDEFDKKLGELEDGLKKQCHTPTSQQY